jgi:hypothetical protein
MSPSLPLQSLLVRPRLPAALARENEARQINISSNFPHFSEFFFLLLTLVRGALLALES